MVGYVKSSWGASNGQGRAISWISIVGMPTKVHKSGHGIYVIGVRPGGIKGPNIKASLWAVDYYEVPYIGQYTA